MTQTAILPRLPTTRALQSLIAANSRGMRVGLGAIPRYPSPTNPEVTVSAEPPYFILHPLWRAPIGGTPFHHPDADSEWNYQLSAYAERTDQLELMVDWCNEILFGRDAAGARLHPIEVPGVRVMAVVPKDDSGTDPDGTASILDYHLRFALRVTPAPLA